jgi:arylsulfatase A-like enzyme
MTDARSNDRAPEPTPDDRRSFLRRGARAGGALAGAGLGLDLLASSPAAASTAGRVPPPLPRSAQPNILVIVVDQMRFPRWFGAGGPTIGFTPNLQRLRNGGVSFARHYTASNDCSPARSTLITGLHTHQTGCMLTGVSTLSPEFSTWGSYLRELGYASYWYGKWHLTRGDRRWNEVNGPPALERYGFDGGTYPSPNGAPAQGWRADPKIAGQFVDWYREAAGDAPWCTAVSFVNPHDIAWWYRWSDVNPNEATAPSVIHSLPPNFETPAQLAARHKPLLQRSLQNTSDLSFGDVPYGGSELLPSWMPFLDLYVKLQLAVDRQIGIVLDTLASRPEVAANTVVIFTSDHGEYGASHGLRGKGAGLYEEGINVPFIVNDLRGQLNVEPELTRTQISSSVDVVPLMLTLAYGSDEWRNARAYSHLANRLDLAAILADPQAPGRQYAVHATDEVVTEFALEPYSAVAPIHVVGLMTEDAKYGVYSHWQADTMTVDAAGQDLELYDYNARAGKLEIDNQAGHSPLEAGLRETLATAIADELEAPLPKALQHAQRAGFKDYFNSERAASQLSARRRRSEIDQIIGEDLGGALTPGGGHHRHHHGSTKRD